MRFDANARARERCGEDDRAAKGQRVGGVGLGGIDVDTFIFSERSGVEPGAVREKRIAAEAGNGGFQMKAASDGNDDDVVAAWSKNGRELADAFGVAALREADKKFSADAKDVATLRVPGRVMCSRFRNFLSACAREAASRRRVSVPSGRITASSSRTTAGSSTNMESGRSGSAGREITRAPSCSRSFS